MAVSHRILSLALKDPVPPSKAGYNAASNLIANWKPAWCKELGLGRGDDGFMLEYPFGYGHQVWVRFTRVRNRPDLYHIQSENGGTAREPFGFVDVVSANRFRQVLMMTGMRLAENAGITAIDPDKKGLTLNAINKELKRRGIKEVLVKGRGYFYFTEGDAVDWYDSSIPVNSISQMSINDILFHYDQLKSDYRNR